MALILVSILAVIYGVWMIYDVRKTPSFKNSFAHNEVGYIKGIFAIITGVIILIYKGCN